MGSTIMTSEELDKISWVRTEGGFDLVLGKLILRRAFEIMKGPRVLDVGCGDGSLTKEMVKRYDKVVGIDGSEDKIELARKNVPGVEFHTSLFEDFKYDEKFDSIIMINILEHVDDPVQFLRKSRGLLAPHGEVIIFVPNALSLNRRVGKAMGLIKSCYELSETDLIVGHKRFYDMEKLKGDTLRSGLKVVEMGGVLLKPLSNSQMESWNPDIIEALYEVGRELPDYCGPIYVRAVR